MVGYWILKTEPSAYSFDLLAREKTTVWDGVKNAVALRHLRSMKRGDQVLIYHSGKEKALVGLAKIASGAYPDPEQGDEKLVVVDIRVSGRLPRPVTLAEIKADKTFADLGLVRMGRLSVVPVKANQWRKLLQMGGR